MTDGSHDHPEADSRLNATNLEIADLNRRLGVFGAAAVRDGSRISALEARITALESDPPPFDPVPPIPDPPVPVEDFQPPLRHSRVVTLYAPSANLAAQVATSLPDTTFVLAGGTYTFAEVVPQNGHQFVVADGAQVRVAGAGRQHCFKGAALDVVIDGGPDGRRFQIDGFTKEDASAESAAILGKTQIWALSSKAMAANWYIRGVDLKSNGECGMYLGDYFTVVNCEATGHRVTGFSGNRFMGGTLVDCEATGNGFDGASGIGSNAAQMKFVWINSDVNEHTDWQANRISGYTRAKAPFRVIRANVHDARYGIWFDLDCRDVTVEDSVFTDMEAWGTFFELSNGGTFRRNKYFRCGKWTLSDPVMSGVNRYVSHAAAAAGTSDNVDIEDNEFVDCPNWVCVTQGARAKPGGDIVSAQYPIASASRNFMLSPSYAPISRGEKSTVGASHYRVRRNKLKGDCRRAGFATNPTLIPANERNPDTHVWQDNDYTEVDQEAMRFWWDGSNAMTLAQWQQAGRQ